MTILHYGKPEINPRMVAQEAYARRQYAQKHFSKTYGSAYIAAVGAGTPGARAISAGARRRQARGGPTGAAYAHGQDSTSVCRSAANGAAQAENGNESPRVNLIDTAVPSEERRFVGAARCRAGAHGDLPARVCRETPPPNLANRLANWPRKPV